jgi:hypothetical protein
MVLEAFVGRCPPALEARHFPDRDPGNNALSNLSWTTHAVNMADQLVHGTVPRGERHYSRTRPHLVPRGRRQGQAKLTDEKVASVHAMLAAGHLQRVIAARVGVAQTAVSRIKLGKSWKHVPRAELQRRGLPELVP